MQGTHPLTVPTVVGNPPSPEPRQRPDGDLILIDHRRGVRRAFIKLGEGQVPHLGEQRKGLGQQRGPDGAR